MKRIERVLIGHIERAIAGERDSPPPAAKPIPCCGNCRFWVRGQRIDPRKDGAYIAIEHVNGGECHRRAPTSFPWPPVPEYEWCGEHEYFPGD